ncbi:MAG: TatD family hydrolase [Phycisphaerales bacterium]|nr:TatD family hydrolase [Phycisphaerales bacterium]
MIDTHCHLTFPDYAPGSSRPIESVLADAKAAGVTGCVTISTTTRDCLDALAIAERFENVWCTAGVHPLYADEGPHEWANLARCIAHPRCVAWGELGLDNHYPEPARQTQHAVLEEQLAFIASCMRPVAEGGLGVDKPVEIHCREAFADLIPILRRSPIRPERFVFHCFTGDEADMRRILDFGAWASFTGVLTYKNAEGVRRAARMLPIDRVMVETDAPFLTPEPHRGVRPNEPRFVRRIAEVLADVHGVGFGAMREQLNANTSRFFGIRVPAA